VAALARAYRRGLVRRTRALLDYSDAQGLPRLRAAIASMLAATRGLAASADDVLVTRGSQMALSLAARALVQPGDAVAVETLGYRPAWDAFRVAGAEIVPLALDAEGAQVEALLEISRRHRLRAVYLTPHHQYPTMVTLAPGRRMRLLELARARRFAVVEDDYDHEFHYEGRPVLPLASVDRSGAVIYVGTLSKVLAPGLRLGYVVAPEPVLARMTALRGLTDSQGDLPLESAVAELIEDGELQRHVRRARRIYDQRRHALLAALDRRFGPRLRVRPPAGGVAVWAEAVPPVDVEAWARRALAEGVSFQPGRRFALDGRPRPFLRLGYACLDEAEIEEAVRRLARSRP
jgi:GntR family transcriptional regulator/MocR family aminotransferase